MKTKWHPQTLHYGIIGCGHSSRGHAKSIIKNKDAHLVAVFDINRDRATKMARQYRCTAKPTLEAMLVDPAIDALIICTPHDTHKELILKTIAVGKYCTAEKPLGMNSRECKQILNSRHYNNNVFLVYQVRFNTAIQFLFDLIHSGTLGKLRYCNARVMKNRDDNYFKNNWRGEKERVGGMLFNQGAHAIDLMTKLCGKPKKTASIMKRFRTVTELEDLFVASIEFKNGAIGTLEVTTYAKPRNLENSIFIIGDSGSVKVGGHTFDTIEYVNLDRKSAAIPKILHSGQTSHEKILESINNFILRKKIHPLLPFAEDGARAIAFTEFLYRSVL